MRIGLAATSVVLAACSVGGDATATSTTSPPSTVVEGPVAVTELVVGDCVDDVTIGARQRAELGSVRLVSCDATHGLEVFTTFRLRPDDFESTPPGEFPGRARIVTAADQGCLDGAETTGIDTERYGLVAFWPTRVSWASGDRVVACAIYDAAGVAFTERQLGAQTASVD